MRRRPRQAELSAVLKRRLGLKGRGFQPRREWPKGSGFLAAG